MEKINYKHKKKVHNKIKPAMREVFVEYETKSRAGVTYKHYKSTFVKI